MQSNHPKGPSHNSGGFSPRELDSIYYWLPETSEAPLYPHKDAVLISRDLLKRTYFETFNFYFSKPINEILANLSLPHVILYRDYLYYDDENEYLKRYYRLDESFPRIQNLSKFYSNTSEGLTKPNLAVHEQNKIILKRNNKLHKYYINKLQNFADIPQTQRDPHPNEDFRILNNLHDDDGYSEDIYSHERRRKANEERYVPEHQQHEHEGGVHNSFQQMLEKYEEATAKVSFESNQHDMYDPENSSASPRAENRSENISFDRSAEFSMKLQDKDFNMFQRQVLMEARPSDRGDERLHDGHRDHEDQIPHNLSNFALSDASDLHFINDMIRSSVDDNLTGALNNNYIRETVHAYAEKTKVPVHERQKENEEVEKEKIKPTTLATKSHATKSKSTSTNHIPNKQSDSMPKKMKIPLEKAKTLKEPDSAPVHGEKPLKSIERNLHSDKGAIQAFISTKREKEDATLDKSQRSARNTDVFEKMSPRDLQYPALSLKNIPISQVKQQIENGKKPSEVKMSATPYDDKNFFNKNRKSAPQAGKKSSGSYKKLSIPGDLKASLEKSPTPVNSAQYIQGLMEKYQKNMEEGHNKSKESTKDTHGAKSKASGDEIERPPKVNELYANTELYAKVAKKAEPKTHHHLSRSKTDEALLKDLYQNRPKTLLKTSPTKVLNNQPASARTVVLSPTNPRKEKMVHRFGSNEGLSPRLFNSSTNKLITQLSSENCKSLAENFPEDRFYSTSGNYKSMKIEKIFAYKRTEMKPPMKSAAAQKSDASNNLSTNMRRLTAAHTYSGTSSVEKNDLNSVPVSPTKKFDLKLNLNRLNQMPNRHQKEASTENSYGFWTSRSARLGPDEESKHLKQSGGTTEERYKNDSSKKEYLLKKNYEPYLETKKKGKTIKKGGSFTNRGITHGLKTREGEGMRNPNLLKSAAHESDLHHMFVQDLHEVNSAGRANILRGGEARLDLNSARNESGRHKK